METVLRRLAQLEDNNRRLEMARAEIAQRNDAIEAKLAEVVRLLGLEVSSGAA